MNAKVLIQNIKTELEQKGFKIAGENEIFIHTLIECFISHIQTQAIVQVATTGTANAQSGVGKII
ncbi:hypothetical protein [Helicobacter cappadocius]|uniref:Uncharacterized protein n=1 Tax=Helicobacter cappadocius TaxID=3063998 RepID=A0AA90STA0_9HELI|nr:MULTISPECIES: hypothetical protein [unclassified Helicobacter]MDO7253903.1 hypothetical protein [Helicobacter sp. faydin-H75]MDP2539764.1 hypothetical protein [Helicobacter sp. faydin-H76]